MMRWRWRCMQQPTLYDLCYKSHVGARWKPVIPTQPRAAVVVIGRFNFTNDFFPVQVHQKWKKKNEISFPKYPAFSITSFPYSAGNRCVIAPRWRRFSGYASSILLNHRIKIHQDLNPHHRPCGDNIIYYIL